MNNTLATILILLAMMAGIGMNTMLVTTGVVSGICSVTEDEAPPLPRRK